MIRNALSFPFSFSLILAALVINASASEKESLGYLEEIVVIGSQDEVTKIAGSGSVIEQSEIDQFDHIDLGQLLGSVAGIYIREEDGFGLMPNIGIRRATSDRSQKITIMEDGV